MNNRFYIVECLRFLNHTLGLKDAMDLSESYQGQPHKRETLCLEVAAKFRDLVEKTYQANYLQLVGTTLHHSFWTLEVQSEKIEMKWKDPYTLEFAEGTFFPKTACQQIGVIMGAHQGLRMFESRGEVV
jgi:hypothetical protein